MAAVLNQKQQWFEEHLLKPLRDDRPPSERIRIMCKNVDELYNRGQRICLLAVLTLGGESNELFHAQIKLRSKNMD